MNIPIWFRSRAYRAVAPLPFLRGPPRERVLSRGFAGWRQQESAAARFPSGTTRNWVRLQSAKSNASMLTLGKPIINGYPHLGSFAPLFGRRVTRPRTRAMMPTPGDPEHSPQPAFPAVSGRSGPLLASGQPGHLLREPSSGQRSLNSLNELPISGRTCPISRRIR